MSEKENVTTINGRCLEMHLFRMEEHMRGLNALTLFVGYAQESNADPSKNELIQIMYGLPELLASFKKRFDESRESFEKTLSKFGKTDYGLLLDAQGAIESWIAYPNKREASAWALHNALENLGEVKDPLLKAKVDDFKTRCNALLAEHKKQKAA